MFRETKPAALPATRPPTCGDVALPKDELLCHSAPHADVQLGQQLAPGHAGLIILAGQLLHHAQRHACRIEMDVVECKRGKVYSQCQCAACAAPGPPTCLQGFAGWLMLRIRRPPRQAVSRSQTCMGGQA